MVELNNMNSLENIPKQNNSENEKVNKNDFEEISSFEKKETRNDSSENNNLQSIQKLSDELKKSDSILKDDVKLNDKELEKKIENILEKDLGELYIGMPEKKKKEFKERGEETANRINILLKEVKVKVNKIIILISDWLNIIPGVNKFFIKQSAKIKTDEILKLKK